MRKENALIGCIIAWVLGEEVQILDLAIDPAHRRLGCGLLLLKHLLAWATLHACESATLEVRSSNAGALGLYVHIGFRQVHIRRSYYQDGEDAVLMSKALKGI